MAQTPYLNLPNGSMTVGTLTATTLTATSLTAAGAQDLNGYELILDADADTSITADTDDQIDIKISGADDFRFTANTFTSLSGSTIATNTIAETTADSGVTVDGLLVKDGAVRGLRTSSTTAVAIAGATALTLADSGGIFTVDQGSAYDIDLPSPTSGPGCTYIFSLTAPAANAVTLTVLGGAATFVGTIANDVTSVLPATGATLTFASGAALGDTIIARSIATNLYHVQAISSAAGGITIA